MREYSQSEDRQPLFYLGEHPVRAAGLVALVFAVSMVLTALIIASGKGGWLQLSFAYYSDGIRSGRQLWQLLTHPFINPPDLWLALSIIFLWYFGSEVEFYTGRKAFLKFFAWLVAIPPLVALPFSDVQIMGMTYGFEVFLAFALFYPTAKIWGIFPALPLALVVLAVNALMQIAGNNWAQFSILAASSLFTWGYIRNEQGRFEWPQLTILQRKPKFRVVRKEDFDDEPEPALPRQKTEVEDIDPLLDKIAKSGIESLTADEKARLEKARQALLKRGK